jgi:type IV fimbrial biogenesis protein FimT
LMRRVDSHVGHVGRGVTLVELIIVCAVVAVLAMLAAPSFRDMVLMQRLRAINAQLVTDLQYARSEAAQRKTVVRLLFKSNSSQTCYAIYISPLGGGTRCDCLLGAGNACGVSGTGMTEVRTVSIPRNLGVTVMPPSGGVDAFGFSPINGGLVSNASDSAVPPPPFARLETRVNAARSLRTEVSPAGKPSVCAPDAQTMQVTPCA